VITLAMRTAGIVGLMPSVDGHGALLAASAQVGRETLRTPEFAPIVRDSVHVPDVVLTAASTVGLMPSADCHGALLASSAEIGRETSHAPEPHAAPPHVGGVPPPHPPGNPLGHLLGWFIAAAAGFGVLVLGITLAVRGKRCRVRIIDVPPGEAPDYVRKAWIGLELPLAPGQRGPAHKATQGVVSRRVDGQMDGYVILGSEAVKLLAAHDPEAALWWRTHAPHVLASGYELVFPTEVCDRL
jgi:hypothetical protein